jgi:hypothetical protein
MSLRDDYDSVFRSLSRVELQQGAPVELDVPDLFGGLDEQLWLGYYTEEGLYYALGRYGLWDDFARVGYRTTRLETRCEDPDEHMLRIWSQDPPIDEPLLELVARRDVLRPSDELRGRLGGDFIGVLNIEWLQLQRPDAEFSGDRPPLPGQQHPGLGLGRQIVELLRLAARRLGLEGLTSVPSYFHNAFFYNVEFRYVDPREQGIFLALCRDVLPETFGSVAAASWAITQGMVVDSDHEDESFEWFHDVMVAPLSDRLATYLRSDLYQEDVAQALAAHGFKVFGDALRRDLETRGIVPLDAERIRTWIGKRV